MLLDMLQARACQQADQLAYVFLKSGEHVASSLTYAQLECQARQLAIAIQRQRPRVTSAILLYPTGMDFVLAFYACLMAGVMVVSLAPPKSRRAIEQIITIINECGVGLLLSCGSEMDRQAELASALLQTGCRILCSDHACVDPDSQDETLEARVIGPDDVAFLQYTSGSTSSPKGVMVSHGNLIATLEDLDAGYPHGANGVASAMVTWLPFFHDMGLIYGLLLPLYCGFPCYFMAPLAFVQRPMRWLAAMSTYRGSHSAAPNFGYQLCVSTISAEKVAALDLRHWKVALNGAEPVRAATLDQFAAHFAPAGFATETFCPGYGMAEASLKIAMLAHDQRPSYIDVDPRQLVLGNVVLLTDPLERQTARRLVGNGQSGIGATIHIVDPLTQAPRQAMQVGEIWVGSRSVARGYWQTNGVGQSADTFNAFLANGDGPFLRTGDLGFLYQGQLYITGRLKDVIIVQGGNHHAEDLEFTVQNSHPSLRPAHGAAFSIEVGGLEQPVVIQEVQRGYIKQLEAGKVLADIRQALAQEHDLRVYAIVLTQPGTIHKTTSGKIQRHVCRDSFIAGDLKVIAHCGRYQPLSAASPFPMKDIES